MRRERDADSDSSTTTRESTRTPEKDESGGPETWAFSVKVLASYFHSTKAADLRLCHTAALTSPARTARPTATRPWSLRDRLTEREITKLITAYREGATAASLATAHGFEPQECQAPPAHRRRPPDATYSTSYKGNTGRDTSIAAHVRRSPRAQRQKRTLHPATRPA
jgi:hypothetical protein